MSNASEFFCSDEWDKLVKSSFKEPYSSKVVFSVSLLIVFFASLIGNILTCIVIYLDKSMHTAINYYLFNLAVSDLLLTFPILIISYEELSEEGYILKFNNGVWSCKLFLCIHYMFVSLLFNNGILVTTVLSIERYIAICFPMVMPATSARKRVGRIIFIIWMIAIVETVPLFWKINVIDTGKTVICLSVITPATKIIIGASFVATFMLPLGIMIFVYTMIMFKVTNNEKYNLKYLEIPTRAFRAKHVNKSVVALTVSFVICWLPIFIITIPEIFTDISKLPHFQSWFMILHKIALFNSFCTTALNPLLFSLVSIKFRKSLKMQWNRKTRKSYDQPRTIKTIDSSDQQINNDNGDKL